MIQRVEAGRELSQAALVQLGKSLPDLMDQGVTSFHVDTSNVMEFDSLTLEALLEFEALAKSRGLKVLIDRPSPVLYQALYITGIAERLEVRVDGMGAGAASQKEAKLTEPVDGSSKT
jgi:ABC-type transporter Mla MlaB component